MTMGERIRLLRDRRHLTQAALARRAKISRITILRIEQGSHSPTVATLERIARVLKVKVKDLIPD